MKTKKQEQQEERNPSPKFERIYKWKDGAAKFAKYDATKIYNELERIRQKRGRCTPPIIVEEARTKTSPLHPIIFGLSEAETLRLGYEMIAARLVRSIQVTIITPERKEIDTRAFVSRPDPDSKGKRFYSPVTDNLEDEEGRAYLLQQAWLALRAWRRRYANLSELATVFDAIDNAHIPETKLASGTGE